MKKLVLANQKGGVGKSAIAVQFAFYLHLKKGLRVLFIDLDHQGNSSKSLAGNSAVTPSKHSAGDILTVKGFSSETTTSFDLYPADNVVLLGLEKQAKKHNEFATNLQAFLKSKEKDYDVCVMDTNPNPDIRQLSALVVSDYVLSPLQLNQESVNGVGDLLNHPTVGFNRIKKAINKKLVLLGVLPNMVEPTKFQQDNFTLFIDKFPHLLISNDKGGFAMIKKSTAIPEAQAGGLPVWEIKKKIARDVFVQMEMSFDLIMKKMGLL